MKGYIRRLLSCCCVSATLAFAPTTTTTRNARLTTVTTTTPPQWTPSWTFTTTTTTTTTTALMGMKRPILDQIATTLFQLEKDRVEASSEIDDKGRMGEPMAWSNADSMANQLSVFMANQGYGFKQFVADLVAGKDYDADAVTAQINQFVADHV
jgi:hypothetical protein